MVKTAFFAGVDFSTARQTIINWPNQVTAILDGYRSCRGIPHGVQKDAIQNSWDARKDRKHAKGWSVAFDLFKSKKGNLLMITDAGTTGLTGRVLKPEELQQDLPPDERWGRFENVAFTKDPSEEALGARGRGKFIFVGASKMSTILYDTLRNDGTYRFGYRTITKTESPIDAFDEDDGRMKLKALTTGVSEPLDEVGTRVVILEPIDELIDCIESGEFVRFIGETWWEIIDKFKARIVVRAGKKEWIAKLPVEFVLPEKDTKEYKVWIKERETLKVGGEVYRIKHLHIVRKMSGVVPEDLRGVSIQRGGMKICPIAMRYVPQEITDSVYGYINFDRDLDRALVADEGIEHYDFDFRKSLPRAVRNYIEDELARFAREKLGLGVDPQHVQHEREANAERRATTAINRIARKLGLLGKGILPPPPPPPTPPAPKKPVRLYMPAFEFLRDSRRVNYGESVKKVDLYVVNETDKPAAVRVKLYLLFQDTVIKELLEGRDLEIHSKESAHVFGPTELIVTEAEYPQKGRYSVRAKLVSLRKEDKGTELDIITRYFFVEEDPPEKGLFEKCDAVDFPEEMKTIMGEAIGGGSSGGYIFQYNKNHPAKKAADANEDELTDYLVAIMAPELPWVDLRRPDPALFKTEELAEPEKIVRRASFIIGHILHDYYSS